MAELTPEQLERIRRDLGGDEGLGDNAHLTDKDLYDNAQRVGGPEYHEAILGLCYRQLLARHSQDVDVQGAEASIKNSQFVAHVDRLYRLYRPALLARLPAALPAAPLGRAPGHA